MRLVLLVLFTLICAPLLAACEPKIELAPWPAPTVEVFDPLHPPASLTNPSGGESHASITADGVQIRGNWDGSVLVITEITSVKVHGRTRVSTPRGKSAISQHELAHDALFRWCYEREAKALFEDALRGLPSAYRGADSADALNRAAADVRSRMEKALSALMRRMEQLSDAFDNLTKHGASTTLSVEKAVSLAESGKQ